MIALVFFAVCVFLSTPSARRATRGIFSFCGGFVGISIHALREEGDSGQMCPAQRRAISIHALREEGDRVRANSQSSRSSFLSTPSARRATHYYTLQAKCAAYFYPRPPRGGRRVPTADGMGRRNFYPRPPRGGRPESFQDVPAAMQYFYPRPPRGGRPVSFIFVPLLFDFYPRPPRGGRLTLIALVFFAVCVFLSTPSARRATLPSLDVS